MVATIPGDPVQQLLDIDSISNYYGNFDGYSFCSKSYSLVIEPEIKPFWMSIYGNLVIIGANTEIDPEDTVTLTIKIL